MHTFRWLRFYFVSSHINYCKGIDVYIDQHFYVKSIHSLIKTSYEQQKKFRIFLGSVEYMFNYFIEFQSSILKCCTSEVVFFLILFSGVSENHNLHIFFYDHMRHGLW